MKHIREVFKKGTELKANKLDANGVELNRLIELTCKQQECVLALKKIDHKLLQQIITI